MSSSSRASSVTLVGMPGAGKSTVGVLVAKALALDFIDSDLAIQRACGRTLQSYMDERGHLALRQLEEAVICRLDPTDAVMATGGSAIYSDHAMAHLAGAGCVVFLQVSLPVVKARIGDFGQRGIAKPDSQSLSELFQERDALYRRWADVVLPADEQQEFVADAVVAAVQQWRQDQIRV